MQVSETADLNASSLIDRWKYDLLVMLPVEHIGRIRLGGVAALNE